MFKVAADPSHLRLSPGAHQKFGESGKLQFSGELKFLNAWLKLIQFCGFGEKRYFGFSIFFWQKLIFICSFALITLNSKLPLVIPECIVGCGKLA